MLPLLLLAMTLAGCASSSPTLAPPCVCPKTPTPPVTLSQPYPKWQDSAQTFSTKVDSFYDSAREIMTSAQPK
jgi:hypothetical protein